MKKYCTILILGLVFSFSAVSVFAQNETGKKKKISVCSQDKDEKLELIRKAESSKKFRVRRVEFSGNAFTRDWALRKRMKIREGDIFKQKLLLNSIRSLSKSKYINPIYLENVKVTEDRKHRMIDMVFCVVERKRK